MSLNFDYSHVDVKTELVTILKAELQNKGLPTVKVLRSDPKSPAEMPCIGINRVDDTETSQSMGDVTGNDFDAVTSTYTNQFGTFFSEAVEIRIWHTNADERDKLYRLMKAIVFAYRMTLVEKGLLNITMRGGRDEQDNTMQHAPDVIYWSTITMSYLNPLDINVRETVSAITDILDNGQMNNG